MKNKIDSNTETLITHKSVDQKTVANVGQVAFGACIEFNSSLRSENDGMKFSCASLAFTQCTFPQVLVIERKNEDGTWPRQASHPK